MRRLRVAINIGLLTLVLLLLSTTAPPAWASPVPGWARTYGGTGADSASSVQQTSDGGFIVAGDASSFGAGFVNVWVLRLDAAGSVVWQKTYGGTATNGASSVQQTSDGGFIVAGFTTSFGAGFVNVWVLRLDAAGSVVWQKTYGGTGADGASSVQQTSDGGFIVAGSTTSFGAGAVNAWVLKLDSKGNIGHHCSVIGLSSAVVASTAVSPSTTVATVTSSSATVTSTSVTGTPSSATTSVQCHHGFKI